MGKEQFLESLRQMLHRLPVDERERILAYYCEMIDDKVENGQTEIEAVCELGDIHLLAQKILEQSSPDSFEYKTFQVKADGIHTVNLSAENKAIIIEPTDDTQITVSYESDQNQEYHFSSESGTLTIRNKELRHIRNWLFGNLKKRKITVHLPKSFSGNLNIKTSDNSILISNFGNLDELICATTNSPIKATSIAARVIQLESNNAAITLNSVSVSSKLSVETLNGAVTFHSVSVVGELSVETLNNAVSLNSVSVTGKVSAKTHNSTITLNSVFASDKIYAETGNADVIISDLESPNIFLKTQNAAIRGAIRGKEDDYSIRARTTNAASNLNNRSGASKKLDVETTNAAIRVNFKE